MPEYEAWKETASPGWTIKYYKGLGTSDKTEAQEYFADIDQHRKNFVYEGTLSASCHFNKHHSTMPRHFSSCLLAELPANLAASMSIIDAYREKLCLPLAIANYFDLMTTSTVCL